MILNTFTMEDLGLEVLVLISENVSPHYRDTATNFKLLTLFHSFASRTWYLLLTHPNNSTAL